jgi:hypothetical protein
VKSYRSIPRIEGDAEGLNEAETVLLKPNSWRMMMMISEFSRKNWRNVRKIVRNRIRVS